MFFKGLYLKYNNKNTNFGYHAYFIYKRFSKDYKLPCEKLITDFLYVFLDFLPGN